MSSRFISRRADGSVIIDSDHICMGLVKSGYMQYLGTWQRYRQEYANSSNMVTYNAYDPLYGFTVRAEAPLVYIAGRGVKAGSTRNGDDVTFYFSGASTSTRFFVYDLMSDRGPGVKMRLRRADGTVSFDSDQLPLNIAGTLEPPGPSSSSGTYAGYGRAYAGGSVYAEGTGGNYTTAFSVWSSYVGTGDYAAALPWSRSARHTQREGWTGEFTAMEGVYGNGNNVTFIFMTDAGASYNSFFQGYFTGYGGPVFFFVPTDRKPVATFIDVSVLPFPFDITGT